jgi:hypothetical protein
VRAGSVFRRTRLPETECEEDGLGNQEMDRLDTIGYLHISFKNDDESH